MTNKNQDKKDYLHVRINYFMEIFIFLIINFLLNLISYFIIPLLISTNSIFYGIFFYLSRALLLLIAIPISLLISNFFIESHKVRDVPSYQKFMELFIIKKNNIKEQLYFGFLLLFIVFIPLDFITYLLIPDMMEYIGRVLTSNQTDIYLFNEIYIIFLFSVIIIQSCVSIYEESLTRGFLAYRGKDHVNKRSAVMISAFYFGFGHFAYFLNPISNEYPPWYPFIWFLQAIIVGIILSLFLIKKKWIFPVIFAHASNNIISAHAVWNYFMGNSFNVVVLYLYVPLISFSALLFIVQFGKIKNYTIYIYNELSLYFHKNDSIGETTGEFCLKIVLDILLGLIIFGLNLIF